MDGLRFAENKDDLVRKITLLSVPHEAPKRAKHQNLSPAHRDPSMGWRYGLGHRETDPMRPQTSQLRLKFPSARPPHQSRSSTGVPARLDSMPHNYHSGVPGAPPSSAHLDRQMRERQQQIDAVAEALVDRYSPRRSPDVLHEPEYHTYAGVFQPAWTYPDSPPSTQGFYYDVGAGSSFPDSEEIHVSSRPLTPVYSTQSTAGRRAQATASTSSNFPQSGGSVDEGNRAYYRSHVSEYPPSLVPAPTAVEGEVRKIYTKRPMHVAPPAPEADNHEAYMREAFSVEADVPLRLESLRDPPAGTRPQYPLPFLCALAIHGSLNRALPSAGIAEALCARFEWFRDHDDPSSNKGWRASVRHLLSLHLIFRAMPRPSNIAGKGSYWKLDFTRGIGNKRPRKRRGRGAVAAAAVGPQRSPLGESDSISDSE